MKRRRALPCAALSVALSAGCSESPANPNAPVLPVEALRDPATCRDCHEQHYQEWAGSMHAYASIDPVFRAMNARGQRETNGELGNFCVNCHAPLAVALAAPGEIVDVEQVPDELQGVTCYFCHSVESVEGTHNNPLRLAADGTMRGSIRNPVENTAHASAYSPFVDRATGEGAAACGACHDIVTPSPPAPRPVALERTFSEWQATIFGGLGKGCADCHMQETPPAPIADVDGVKTRSHRSIHTFPGVDVALTPFVDEERQRTSVAEFLSTSLHTTLCVGQVSGSARLQVQLDNNIAGHAWPTGAAQDRRAWVELVAYDAAGAVLYSSGVVADGEDVTKLPDPSFELWLLRDVLKDEHGNEVHMFWQGAEYVSRTIPGKITDNPADPAYWLSHPKRIYPRGQPLSSVPARVTLRVRVQPMGYDVLDDLIASGDLDPQVRAAMPVFDLLPNRGIPKSLYDGDRFTLEWRPELAEDPRFKVGGSIDGSPAACVTSAVAD